MGRRPKNCPSFFKVLIKDFAHKLPIPPAFVASVPKKLPSSAVVRTRNGESWDVKIEQNGKTHSFMHDGWRNFAKDNRLENGDFLVFHLISDSVFEIVKFGPSGCEKELKPALRSNPEQYKEDPFIAPSNLSPKYRDDSLTGDRISSRRGEVEGADGSSKPTNPSCLLVLKNHHKNSMYIPKAFAEEMGLAKKKRVILRNDQWKVWQVVICGRVCGSADMTAGWTDFRLENNIAIGDTCLFEFIRSAVNLIHVKVLKDRRSKI